MNNKKPWKSKTYWVAAINAVGALAFPSFVDFVGRNPEMYALGLSLLMALLRKLTRGAVSIV